MHSAEDEFHRDALIANRSITLADIAEQLLAEDAGAALVKAALLCWERQHGVAGAMQLASAALVTVHAAPSLGSSALMN